MPLTRDMLVQGWGIFANRGHEWSVVCMGFALSYHLPGTVQGLRDLGVREWSSAPRLLSHEKGCTVVFFRGTMQLAWKDRRQADNVEVTFRAWESDQNRPVQWYRGPE